MDGWMDGENRGAALHTDSCPLFFSLPQNIGLVANHWARSTVRVEE